MCNTPHVLAAHTRTLTLFHSVWLSRFHNDLRFGILREAPICVVALIFQMYFAQFTIHSAFHTFLKKNRCNYCSVNNQIRWHLIIFWFQVEKAEKSEWKHIFIINQTKENRKCIEMKHIPELQSISKLLDRVGWMNANNTIQQPTENALVSPALAMVALRCFDGTALFSHNLPIIKPEMR